MKQSIKKIFRNLILSLFMATIFAGLSVLIAINMINSHKRIENLNNQKHIIFTIINLPKDQLELTLIQFNSKSQQLNYEIEKLYNMYEYNFIERYIVANTEEYLADLDKLSSLTAIFNKKADEYYNKKIKQDELKKSFNSLFEQIDSIIFKAEKYDQIKFDMYKNITYTILALIFLASIWYIKKLNAIYKDLEFLYNVDEKENGNNIFSQEVNTIFLKRKKKPAVTENLTMIDPVTGINNLKGLINSYNEKKDAEKKDFTSITLLEVDNFSKTNRVYSQELTETILKKIAYLLSLHQQAADIIARTDYNQFTLIFSRDKKEELFKDVDNIRENISELRVDTPELGQIDITVSGGFVIKTDNITFEESIKKAKKILQFSQDRSKNKISQERDLAHNDL